MRQIEAAGRGTVAGRDLHRKNAESCFLTILKQQITLRLLAKWQANFVYRGPQFNLLIGCQAYRENGMKIILWIIAIIFIVGLLTLTGVFKVLF